MKPTKKTASTKTTTTTKPASTAAATANKGPLSGNTGKKFVHLRLSINVSPNMNVEKAIFLFTFLPNVMVNASTHDAYNLRGGRDMKDLLIFTIVAFRS